MTESPLMSSREVAEYLGVDLKYFQNKLVFTMGLPAPIRLTPDSHRKWLRSDIDAWLQSKKEVA